MEDELERAIQRGYVVAFRLLRNREEAREVCQEAASRALAKRGEYDPSRPFYPWFYRILRNLCVDWMRDRQRREAVESEPVDPARSAEARVIEHERNAAVERAIAQLSPDMREVIELRHFHDLSYAHMAEQLGVPVGTVMSRLYRARKALREALRREPAFVAEKES